MAALLYGESAHLGNAFADFLIASIAVVVS